MSLAPLPDGLIETRDSFHQLAFFALSPARHQAVGRMGLRPTMGGFGTPEFEGKVARVADEMLVFEDGDSIATQTITTVRAATEFFGVEYREDWFRDFHDPLTPRDPDIPLRTNLQAAEFLARWFEFGFEVLGTLRTRSLPGDDPSEVQMWPEHFDSATELGSGEKGQRASLGVSPGDAGHPEPYIYVAPWSEIDTSDPYWNDPHFKGSSLGYAPLAVSKDPQDRALDFLLEGHRILQRG